MNKLHSIVMEEKKKKNLLMFDLHNLIYRCIHVAHKEDPLDMNYTLWKFLVFNNILTNIKLYKADRVIIAMDSRNYWRKKIYSQYKAHRKKNRDDSTIDFDAFFIVMNKFFLELKQIFTNIIFFEVDTCEADDIIAIITKYESKGYDITSISNDKDLHQLLKYKNYRQYDPLQKKFIKHINSKKELLMKIIMGDKSDNIPAIKEKCGKVSAKKIIKGGLENTLLNKTIKENFDRNKSLIDMDMIPYEIKNKIIDQYHNITIMPYKGRNLFSFLTKNKLVGIIDRIQEFSSILSKLT